MGKIKRGRRRAVVVLRLAVLLGTGLCCMGCAVIADGSARLQGRDPVAAYYTAVEESLYMKHALGGTRQGQSYTNSMEALAESYEEGYRLFEADVRLTSDGIPVLAHDWKKSGYETKLGIDNYREEKADADGRYIPSYQEFMSFSIQKQYTPLSFAQLLDFMKVHTDIYVMIDIGSQSYEDTSEIYGAMVEIAEGDGLLLDRLIAGGHTKDMVRAVKEVYGFPLLNLYFAKKKKRDEEWREPEGFIQYCRQEGISSFSVAAEVYTMELAEVFRQTELICYVFTINEEAEAERYREMGVTVIGTDFL